MGDIREDLEQARKQLLDLGARNRLLNTPRHRARSATIEIVDERSDQVLAQLLDAGQAMGFRARPDADTDGDADADTGDLFADLAPPLEDLDPAGVAVRHRDAWLQTELGAERLQSRLLKLYYDARRYHEERGVDVLYLALGFLEWYEAPSAEQARHAPLLLVPVRLERGSALERFRLRYDGDEIATNLSLVEKLKREFRLALPEIEEAEGEGPATYFERVRAAVADEPRFRIHTDDIVLGLFSFTKLLMYQDLDPASWPEGADPTARPLVRALLGDGFGDQPDDGLEEGRLDQRIDLRDAADVLDADASQAIAIERARRGGNLLIQGPPGTGKSQTIANLIATAVKDGQSVLFVAEKMAALEVVRRRLEQIDLGDMCLELHSHKANKRALLDDLKATLALGRPRVAGVDALCDRLKGARDRLNRYADALHAPLGRAGFSAYHAIGHLLGLARDGVGGGEIRLPGSMHWSRADLDERRSLIEALARRVGVLGTPAAHLWRGVGLEAILPSDVTAIGERAGQLAEQLAVLQQAGRHLARQLDGDDHSKTFGELARLVESCAHLGDAPDAPDAAALCDPVWQTQGAAILALLDAGQALSAARTELAGVVAGAAWSLEVAATRRDLAAHAGSWLRFLNRDYRRARATLRGILIERPPRALQQRLILLDTLIAGQEAARTVVAEGALGARAFGHDWHGERSDWARLEAIQRWHDAIARRDLLPGLPAAAARIEDRVRIVELAAQTGRLRRAVVAALEELLEDLQLDLAEAFGSGRLEAIALAPLRARLAGWAAQPAEIASWIAYRNQARRAVELGLAALTSRLHDGRLPPERAAACFEVAYFEPLMRQAYQAHPELAAFDGDDHDGIARSFRDLDRERIALARAEVAAAHHRGLPAGPGAAGAVKVLHREFHKKRRHLPIRRLLIEAGRPVQAIKPVFMMSPLSVAEFLAPGGLRFDLLVIDEASQVEPVDALGAVARAGRLVVVGDDRQLPPTPFFRGQATEDDEEEGGTADLESILGLCAAQGMAQTMLRWHYRSRHPSLIAVSNREFYDGRLHIVPSPRADDPSLGIAFRHLPEGRFERGGAAINRVEARAVAEAVIAHARERPELSLGVGCFSVRQRDAILHELEHLWRDQPEVRGFFEADRAEPFFVKNLENVQGDERDVVYISVGYARDASGYLAMRFGPLNAPGGERRLNVLITRARRRLEVFSGITADDLDLARAGGAGVAAFKTFLHYARTGILDVAEVTDRGFDSPFEAAVAKALAGHGHQVDSQVGVAGLFVDLAIRDPARPGRHLLGIECDGAAYHSALSARDRDRLRQQVLEDQGWIIHRIWSSDWYRRPDEQLRRALAAIDEAKVRWAARDDGELGPTAPTAGADAADIPRDPDDPSGGDAPDDASTDDAPAARSSTTPYVEVDLVLPDNPEPHLMPPGDMADAVMRIVEVEGPIHRDEIARRVARACGCERTGRRIVEAVRRGLARAAHRGRVAEERGFYQPSGVAPVVRDRSAVQATTLRRPNMLPPVEIRAAALEVARAGFGATRAEIVTQVSRLLGFQATSSQLRRVIEREIDRLVGQRQLARNPGGQLEVPLPETRRSSSKPAA